MELCTNIQERLIGVLVELKSVNQSESCLLKPREIGPCSWHANGNIYEKECEKFIKLKYKRSVKKLRYKNVNDV